MFVLSKYSVKNLGVFYLRIYYFVQLSDCVECMACSDNTIRAGLTPKFKDVDVLCDSLNYNMISPPYFKPSDERYGIVLYAPPVEEFAVQKINVNFFIFLKVL